jgi:uncharacterized membrane protein
MIPFVVLVAATLALRGIGGAGIPVLGTWTASLRGGLFAMFLLTASAHWGKRRPDLIRMVPPAFGRPDLIVTATGLLELLGAAGLLIPTTARAASICLSGLLIAMFPANVRAARQNLTVGGRSATALPLRLLLQLLFIGALGIAGFVNF